MLDPNYARFHHAQNLAATQSSTDLGDMLASPFVSTLGLSPHVPERQPTAGLRTPTTASRCIYTTDDEYDFRQIFIGEGQLHGYNTLILSDDAILRHSLFRPAQSKNWAATAYSGIVTFATTAVCSQLRYLQTSVPILRPQIVRKFGHLTAQWRGTRNAVGSVLEICTNPAYQQIIGMGQDAVPLILRELEQELDHWFWALAAITGENPVHEKNRGRLKLMAQDWFAWARKQGYQW